MSPLLPSAWLRWALNPVLDGQDEILQQLTLFRRHVDSRFADLQTHQDQTMGVLHDQFAAEIKAMDDNLTAKFAEIVQVVADLKNQAAAGEPITQADIDNLHAQVVRITGFDLNAPPTPGPTPTPTPTLPPVGP